MALFVGRTGELALLRKRLDRAAQTGSGVAVAIRGRRQVGKSRLVQEFCDAAGVRYFYFTAAKGPRRSNRWPRSSASSTGPDAILAQ